ncbi:MAG: DedA family protein [Salinibacterium sp.]|nr:DedA family protein [Salinibacterium sp.]
MNTLGAPGAGIAIFIENVFPPIPSEIILPLAGLAASRGDLRLAEVLVWTTAGSLLGAIVLYFLGALLGADRLRTVARRVPLLKVSDIDRSVAWFDRHGAKAVFFGRMLPIFRSLISIPAGITRLNLWLFALLTFLGSSIWNTLFVLAGYLLGENWKLVGPFAEVLQYAVIGAVLLLIVIFVVRRLREGAPVAE